MSTSTSADQNQESPDNTLGEGSSSQHHLLGQDGAGQQKHQSGEHGSGQHHLLGQDGAGQQKHQSGEDGAEQQQNS